MLQNLISSEPDLKRHEDAPFVAERERYLQYCADSGAPAGSLRVKCNELLWAALLLDADAAQGIDTEKLTLLIDRRVAVQNSATTRRRFAGIVRPWLRFLGWWKDPVAVFEFQQELDQFCTWMRRERGFGASTIVNWRYCARDFLKWCSASRRALAKLHPSDIDEYMSDDVAHHWNRLTVATVSGVLRIFLRYAASQGWCAVHLAQTVRSPRVYAQESLPMGPGWATVQTILANTLTDDPVDIRDRAILMLLSIYGMRSSEVASLLLDQIDWQHRVIRVFRLKRRQPQVFPLLSSVAEALARYIDTVRPPAPHPEVFISLLSPQRPIKRGAIYRVVSKRLLAFGVDIAHHGPHSLRHACATRLIAQGATLKEIGDHLGHRSTSATLTYAKVNLAALRAVGDFDLGELL
jgi:integrase/recombinase XerD